MIKNLLIAVALLFTSISLCWNYNSGLGGPLGSPRKKFIYAMSLLSFIDFVAFLNRAYYFSDNQKLCNFFSVKS